MENKNFDKYDRRLKEQLKGFSDRPVPPEIRKDFAASVAKKIGEGQGRWVMPGFVPGVGIFIVALMGWLFVWNGPKISEQPMTVPQEVVIPAVQMDQAIQAKEQDLAEEIAILEDLGEWTDQDDQELGISLEELLVEVELAFEGESVSVNISPKPAI